MSKGSRNSNPKHKCWMGIPKRRCTNPGCKKRIRSHFDVMLCNKCFKEKI